MSQTQELELLTQKSDALKKYYITVQKAKIARTLEAQKLIEQLPIPTTEADITATEAGLVEVKRAHKAMLDATVTEKAPFNNFLSTLDEPHKTLLSERTENGKKIKEGHIALVESALLELKKAQHERLEAERKKAEDRQLYGSRLKRTLIDRSTAKELELKGWIKTAFEFALDKVEVGAIDGYIGKVKEKKGKDCFLYHDGLSAPIGDAELEAIHNSTIIEHLPSPETLKAQFDSELDMAFVDFANAKKNKEVAKAQLEAEMEEQKIALHTQTNNNIVAEQIRSASQATPTTSIEVGKKLKRKEVLDMPDNFDTVRAIIVAYAQHSGKIEAVLRNKSAMGTTIKQIATAIEKLNNEGVIFDGLIFKEDISL